MQAVILILEGSIKLVCYSDQTFPLGQVRIALSGLLLHIRALKEEVDIDPEFQFQNPQNSIFQWLIQNLKCKFIIISILM